MKFRCWTAREITKRPLICRKASAKIWGDKKQGLRWLKKERHTEYISECCRHKFSLVTYNEQSISSQTYWKEIDEPKKEFPFVLHFSINISKTGSGFCYDLKHRFLLFWQHFVFLRVLFWFSFCLSYSTQFWLSCRILTQFYSNASVYRFQTRFF